ncbi:unnamed protein product, partial [Ectocarpus sp. 12 AP-2014]
VERWPGGEGKFGDWLGNAHVLPVALESLAEEIEARRRTETCPEGVRGPGAAAAATALKSRSSGGKGGNSGGGGDEVFLMGCVRAAQVAASGSSLEGHHPAAGTRAEDGEEDDDDGSDGGGGKGEDGGRGTKKTKIRMPMKRERIKSRVSVRSARTYDPSRLGPTVVYDPSDRISRFHPRYELLIEAGSFYMQVRPDLLHDKVEELDAILIEQATRSLRRKEAPTGFKVWEGLEKDERRRRRARARKESEARERHAQRWMGNVSRKRRRQLVREMVKREREEEEQR